MLFWRGKGGMELSRNVSEAVGLRKAFIGPVCIVFGGGEELRVDPFASNAPLVLKTVSDRLYPDDGINEG